ncbi:hypothetical protein AG1IA_09231 [Rhizoctonia solani AG-1 IA]|uniref:Uncharacterized protein n=1 Tax=Thanatephorus cucumeris (strain AG1-IA) TaxID=983506 RepID=L8WK51_THACA|nr:hypothetical protein AG1IA_09231 [Rhizoctonia solani AG-1 IA]
MSHHPTTGRLCASLRANPTPPPNRSSMITLGGFIGRPSTCTTVACCVSLTIHDPNDTSRNAAISSK